MEEEKEKEQSPEAPLIADPYQCLDGNCEVKGEPANTPCGSLLWVWHGHNLGWLSHPDVKYQCNSVDCTADPPPEPNFTEADNQLVRCQWTDCYPIPSSSSSSSSSGSGASSSSSSSSSSSGSGGSSSSSSSSSSSGSGSPSSSSSSSSSTSGEPSSSSSSSSG